MGGDILFSADNTIDIGASGATRPRTGYFGTGLVVSAGATLSLFNSTGLQVGANSSFYWAGRTIVQSPVDGQLSLYNSAGTGFGLVHFGGTTSAFPAIKRSAALLQARLADDSLFTELECSNIITNNATAAFSTNTTLTDFAAAALGTLTNSPTAGNPAKWCSFDDNGTQRFFPTWV